MLHHQRRNRDIRESEVINYLTKRKMRANKIFKSAYFNHIGEITLPIEVIEKCSHSDDCTNDVLECMQNPEIKAELSKINPESLEKELLEYGAWEDDKLTDHDENLMRILWLSAGQISDETK